MFVLVVDDDEDFLLLSRRALEARGHDVHTTSTAFGLVNRVAGTQGGRRPDVVILDCDLPGLTGFSAIELLAKDRRTSAVPILLVSAAYSPQHLDAARMHPRALFMQKDGHLRALVEKLEAHASETQSAVAVSTLKS
jgi:CheY-like chemotaxis protein